MNLLSVQIKNFRSIDDISLETSKLADNSFTYGLIGINEAGKSSILKAIALKDGLIPFTTKDFRDPKKPIEILFNYQLSEKTVSDFEEMLNDDESNDEPNTPIRLGKDILVSYAFTLSNISKPTISVLIPDRPAIPTELSQHILNNVHKAIFWTAEDKYLISQPINLTNFAVDPNLSIPLKNCFTLAGIEDIKGRITSLSNDSTEREQLQDQLGEKVTEHIKAVWPNHPLNYHQLKLVG